VATAPAPGRGAVPVPGFAVAGGAVGLDFGGLKIPTTLDQAFPSRPFTNVNAAERVDRISDPVFPVAGAGTGMLISVPVATSDQSWMEGFAASRSLALIP